ncbi:MAG: FitA-like ribbon-helix-helix domain-containing protein [Rhodospirillales bacterium]
MAQVVIRNIDDAVIEKLRARARAKKQSLEQTLREVLTDAARPSRAELLAEMARIRAMAPPRPKDAPTMVELIRQGRDER